MQIDSIHTLGYNRFAFRLYPTQSQTESDAKKIHMAMSVKNASEMLCMETLIADENMNGK